jgi:nitrate reductase gamma subunit
MDTVLFAVFPYVAFTLAILGGVYRYFNNRFSYSSLSSQLLENRQLFWGSVPWHYGIILILLAHLFAGLFPGAARYVLDSPWRLYAFEVAGMALALSTLFGLIVLFIRRVRPNLAPHVVTSNMDWILLLLFIAQVTTGLGISMGARWGSLWYLSTAVPWFWSIFRLHPNYSAIAPLPTFVLFHMFNGFVLILLFPFSRLVHIFTVPLDYLWRPYQVVIWNRQPRGKVTAL